VEVTVVIPVLNDGARLQRCLDALAAQRDAPPFEVLVVDNGSSDDTAQVAARHPLAPTLLEQRRRGSYAARNTALAAATSEVLAFTDADCVPDAAWVAAGHRALRSAPVVGGEVLPMRAASPTVWERYDCAIYLKQESLVAQGGFAATANLWVRASVLAAVGPFDPSLLSSGDFEWGQRAAAAGFSTTYAGDVVVAHTPRSTARQTWSLHRRLGAGWRVLAPEHPQLRDHRDVPLWRVIEALALDGPPLRRRQVAHVHAVAMGARRLGWAEGRTTPRVPA
jgi:glycosyltransferase involved in cell wall biosynthesis